MPMYLIRVYGLNTREEITSFREKINGSLLGYHYEGEQLDFVEFDTNMKVTPEIVAPYKIVVMEM